MSRFRYLAVAFAMALAGGCAGSPSSVSSGIPSSLRQGARNATQLCPANPNGSGILADGDFSQAPDPGDTFQEYSKPTEFAPSWMVSKFNIDLYGSTAWTMAGYCSVDLDGNRHGGITSAPFATTAGTRYDVSFLLSGNGGSKPLIKTFQIFAAGQSQVFGWSILHGHTVQNGKYASVNWSFTADEATTTLEFLSLDRHDLSGAVIAAISVTAASSQKPRR